MTPTPETSTPITSALDTLTTELSRQLTDEGRLIEAGWAAMLHLAVSPRASPSQIRDMRMAFFAGAQHLFASLMTVLEAGDDPTNNDMRRVDLIAKELDDFISQLEATIKAKAGAGATPP